MARSPELEEVIGANVSIFPFEEDEVEVVVVVSDLVGEPDVDDEVVEVVVAGVVVNWGTILEFVLVGVLSSNVIQQPFQILISEKLYTDLFLCIVHVIGVPPVVLAFAWEGTIHPWSPARRKFLDLPTFYKNMIGVSHNNKKVDTILSVLFMTQKKEIGEILN